MSPRFNETMLSLGEAMLSLGEFAVSGFEAQVAELPQDVVLLSILQADQLIRQTKAVLTALDLQDETRKLLVSLVSLAKGNESNQDRLADLTARLHCATSVLLRSHSICSTALAALSSTGETV